ncbi:MULTISPECIES: PD-(D/E)XK nuclease-like domain-containing protein [Olivibacter]|uniref:PD-(D/E)XK nuclease-like domain-containing protein n=1 Tax=Olivibacter jilunii TaxID=985016 RepID=A0ABW6AWK6_9SPHI|nr:PD-(D/E)XK nuclease-like domain-containing protein [Pseudosphingobacterium sp.]
MDINNFDLSNAEVIDQEINPLSYNPDDYPGIDEFVERVLNGNNRPVYTPDLKALSLNGRVVADKMDRYLAAPYNSSSALKEIHKNPAAYYFYVNDKSNFEETESKSFELGTFCHSAFLEPDKFDKVIVEPNYPRNSWDGVNKLVAFWEGTIWNKYTYKGVAEKKLQKALLMVTEKGLDVKKLDGAKCYIDCLQEVSEYTAISEKHKLIIELIKRYYYSYGGGIIPAILRGAQFETSFYTEDPNTGLKVKVRPDAFNIEENIGFNTIISFKTTSAPDMGKFLYDSAKYKYELSEGMYQEVTSHVTGRKFNVTIMIVLQTVPPYLPAVFFWAPEDLENGKYKYRYALDTIRECVDKGLYPGFEALAESGHYGIIQMHQPEWATKLLHPVDLED